MLSTSLRTGKKCDTFCKFACNNSPTREGDVMQEVMGTVTEKQKEILLRGLRFVRSSVKLGMSTPTEEVETKRATDLEQVEALIAQIDAITPG